MANWDLRQTGKDYFLEMGGQWEIPSVDAFWFFAYEQFRPDEGGRLHLNLKEDLILTPLIQGILFHLALKVRDAGGACLAAGNASSLVEAFTAVGHGDLLTGDVIPIPN